MADTGAPVHVNARLPAGLVARVEDLGGEGGRTAGLRRAAEVGLATLDRAEQLIPAAVAAGALADGDVVAVPTPRLRMLLAEDPVEAAAIEAQLARQKMDFERFGMVRREREQLVNAVGDAIVKVIRLHGEIRYVALPACLRAAWKADPALLDPRWSDFQVAGAMTDALSRLRRAGRIRDRKAPARLCVVEDEEERRAVLQSRADRGFHITLLGEPLDAEEQELLQQVRPWVRRHGRVTSDLIAEEWEIDQNRAWRLLRALGDLGELELVAKGAWRAVR